ncbi:DUF4150 domain-containing protein [Serratia silvae]|uniref:DUF4150 domain-containing protein n=1 Tax=Serratia silvae TaxID=2824122 RepID=A0ABT0KB03_9GAMM|nr:DUF4150 domain-containing protein [Serratia silvae]MCL1029172.1 DUF4150 domain-containing protein [Serratia silvae]
MAKEVFANGREVSSKKSGDTRFCPPIDICHSPPPPPPTPKIGIPIPYPNFSQSSTLAQGSKTVNIKGAPISLKNTSYYKKSSGNEVATNQLKEGVISGKIKGKCYATGWSFDVRVEGKNVTRQLDGSRHNDKNTV